MTQIELAHDVSGDGPLLVLVHGITENRHAWDPVPLDGQFRVVRVDLRGHGQSPGEPPYDMLTLAHDVHETVAKAGSGEPPIVVGHSIGGVVVTAYASQFPVSAVINVDQSLALSGFQAQFQQAAPMLRGDGLTDFVTALFGQLYGGLDSAEAARLSQLRRPNREALLGMWAPLLDQTPAELESLVSAITALPPGTPYLSLHGFEPEPGYAGWLGGLISGATVEVWADPPTHYPHLAAPERFAQRVRELLPVR